MVVVEEEVEEEEEDKGEKKEILAIFSRSLFNGNTDVFVFSLQS